MALNDNLAVIGRIVKPLGITGEVLVEPLTFDPDRFHHLSRAAIEGSKGILWQNVSHVRKKGKLLILKFEEFNNPKDVLPFKGAYIKIEKVHSPALPANTYYYYQLEGLSVFDEEGSLLGEVKSIMKGGGADIYIVKDCEGTERLIPALRDVILSVNLSEKKMIVRLPEII